MKVKHQVTSVPDVQDYKQQESKDWGLYFLCISHDTSLT